MTGALAADPSTAGLALDINVQRGVVRLAGETTTRDEASRAIAIARAVPDVKRVVADLRLNDVWIVERVRQLLVSDPIVRNIPIRVDARRGFVRLMSEATNQTERTRAMQLARQADGVEGVEDRMR